MQSSHNLNLPLMDQPFTNEEDSGSSLSEFKCKLATEESKLIIDCEKDNSSNETPDPPRPGNYRNVLNGVFYRLLVLQSGGQAEILLGFGLVLTVGSIVGIFLPSDSDDLSGPYKYVSGAIGYTYTIAWSISFYPQVISNYLRKSTKGLSADFVILNTFGFLCYAVFNGTLYFRHEGDEHLVRSNDVVFSFHAFFICLVTLGQIQFYDGTILNFSNSTVLQDDNQSRSDQISETPSQCQVKEPSASGSPSQLIKKLLIILVAMNIAYAILNVSSGNHFKTTSDGTVLSGISDWLHYLYFLSYIKILITLIKYIPQVLLNYQRKSTQG